MEMNEVLEKLPKHLMCLVIDQPYNLYTAQDHAVWRYVMRRNVDYFPKVAHASYLDGLEKTGISIESIPHMYGMNRILKKIGWAAVAVDGFIPPAAFMEFQAYNVLVIAADIRPIDQIEYTPAPDIIHEAAGHAPIIADPEYSDYLKMIGFLGAKAIPSKRDYELFESIRHLSILKADPYTPSLDIEKAQAELDLISSSMGAPSEMALIRNLHWWSVEYGLFGDLKNPKLYGAGLLSSIGESVTCLQDHVKKIPFTIEAKDYSFDVTRPQPQLFVTPSFAHLKSVIQQFADTMAIRVGGRYGVQKAIDSATTATCVLSSGIQISGTFVDAGYEGEQVMYLSTTGKTALATGDKQFFSYGAGFFAAVGKLNGSEIPPELLTDSELQKLGIIPDREVTFRFQSGIEVKAVLRKLIRENGKLIALLLTNVKITFQGKDLFNLKDGEYYLAVGEKVTSVFYGPADPEAFGLIYQPPEEKTHKINHSDRAKSVHSLYQEVRKIREEKNGDVERIWQKAKVEAPEEWLLGMEIFELSKKDEVKNHLLSLKSKTPDLTRVIDNGISAALKIN